jgi:hypothetical protein
VSGQVTLQGSLVAGPPVASDGGFPATSSTTQLGLNTTPKPFTAGTPTLSQTVNSPSSFVQLMCVSTNGPVVNADTFYVKCDGPCVLRLTFDDGTGTNTPAAPVLIPLQGTCLLEPPAQSISGVGGPLLKAELQGAATVEFYASGPK